MVKAIESYGIPVVHVCTIVPISQTVGANRIVPAVAIPHPLGDPTKKHEEELHIRRAILDKAHQGPRDPGNGADGILKKHKARGGVSRPAFFGARAAMSERTVHAPAISFYLFT